MKLVFLIDCTKKIGGGTYAQFLFAKTLASRGHQIVIFAGDKSFVSRELRDPNLTVFYKPTISIFIKKVGIGKVNDFIGMVYKNWVIKPFLKRDKPDWLIGYLRESSIKAQVLGEKLDIKVANFIFENPLWMEQELQIKLHKRFMKAWLKAKPAYEKADLLIPNSKLAGLKMREWIPSANISTPVYPGIAKIKKESVIRDIDIIYIGRLHALKNVDELLKACKSNHRMVIIGSGEERQNLIKITRVKSLNVEFLGAVSDKEKWSYLQRSKLLVFPSSFEGFGMPPLEALASGCRVLCSDLPIFREIYDIEVSYFELHNIEAMSTKIDHLLSDVSIIRSYLPQKYTWQNAARSIESILGDFSRKKVR